MWSGSNLLTNRVGFLMYAAPPLIAVHNLLYSKGQVGWKARSFPSSTEAAGKGASDASLLAHKKASDLGQSGVLERKERE